MSSKPKEEKKEEKKDGEEKKGSPIIKIAILGVIVVALGAGGYVGWIKFFKKPPEETATAAQVEKKTLHDWEPFLVNLADVGGRRYLKVVMKLELNGPKAQEEMVERGPELRDAVIMILSSKEFDDIASSSGKTRLKQEILNRLNKSIKNGQVKEIYFTEFIVQ